MRGPSSSIGRGGIGATSVLTVLVVAVLASLLGSCANEPAAEQGPQQAAQTMSERMFLTPETTACLTKMFEAKPELASALNVDESQQASKKRLDDFLAGVRPCLTAPVLADAYVKIVPTGASVTDEQSACIRQTITGLDDTTRDNLILLGVGTLAADPLELNQAIIRVTETCKIAQSLAVPNATGPTVGEGGGATFITR